MCDKTRIMIQNILKYFCIGLFHLNILGNLILAWLIPNKDVALTVIKANFFAFSVSGILYFLSFFILKCKSPVCTEVFSHSFSCYDQLIEYIQDSPSFKNYQLYQSITLYDSKVTIYRKAIKPFSSLKYLMIFYTPELTEKQTQDSQMYITKLIDEYLQSRKLFIDPIEYTCMFCADKATPVFEQMIHDITPQFLKMFKLPVGVCFDEKNIHITTPQIGYRARHQKMRKEILRILKH